MLKLMRVPFGLPFGVPRRLLVKVGTLLMLSFMVIFTASLILQIHTMSEYKLKVQKMVRFKFHQISKNLFASSYQLEYNNEEFLKEITEIKQEKLANDVLNELWEINESLQKEQSLTVAIPDYYTMAEGEGNGEETRKKPEIQPYDPRFTIPVYLNWISMHPDEAVPFHWSDWFDTTKLEKFVLTPQELKASCQQLFDISQQAKLIQGSEIFNVDDYCKDDKTFSLGYKILGNPGPHTPDLHEILGRAYLYSSAPSPKKIVFMTDAEGSYEIEVSDSDKNDLKNSLLHNGMVEEFLLNQQSRQLLLVESFKSVLSTNPPKNQGDLLQGYELHIDEKEFNPDVTHVMSSLEAKSNLSAMEKSYLDFLQYSTSIENGPKYFTEAKILESVKNKALGDHYDWRFFDGILVGREQQMLALHRLVKNYLALAKQHGLITWIAHGSLLSWFWNGIAFPWDSDIDVQMPVQHLYKLGEKFNQTLVVENVATRDGDFGGTGRYFIDVGLSITHRKKGDGNNVIDARFIDVDTGLYIDITGLALTDQPAPSRYDYIINSDKKLKQSVYNEDGEVNHTKKNEILQAYNCRNEHFNLITELSPLILTLVENQPSYIPRNFYMTLEYEYGHKGLTNSKFEDYVYMSNFRMWVRKEKVLDYLIDPQMWAVKHNATLNNPMNKIELPDIQPAGEGMSMEQAMNKVDSLDRQDHINLLQDDSIFREFMCTFEVTKIHELEIEALMDDNYQVAENLVNSYTKEGMALRGDYFVYRLLKDGWDYNKKVAEIESQ